MRTLSRSHVIPRSTFEVLRMSATRSAPAMLLTRLVYSPDLAYIHDAGFTGFAHRAAPELIKILRGHGIRRGLVVDAGCGSGPLAGHLVEAGYDVLGIDVSPAMIRLARERVPHGSFRVG